MLNFWQSVQGFRFCTKSKFDRRFPSTWGVAVNNAALYEATIDQQAFESCRNINLIL